MKLLRYAFLTLSVLLCGCGAQGRDEPVSETAYKLDTVITITLYDNYDKTIFEDAFNEIDRLEGLVSAEKQGSDLDLLAKNAGKDYISVSDETYFLLKESRRFSELSGGAFDCTVGPLVSLWNIKGNTGHYPSETELNEVMPLIGYDNLLFKDDNMVMLKKEGMKITLGAIAKGYIADKIKELLIEKGVKSAVINMGGNIVLIGEKPAGVPFKIGVQDPAKETGEHMGVLEVSDKSLVSSGPYQRYFEREGREYHHILDPKTGFPAENELSGVTIISDRSTDGDGFSTSAFLLGLSGGMELINNSEGIEAIFITRDKKVYVTDGVGESFKITGSEYTFGEW